MLEMDGTVVHGNPAFERYFPDLGRQGVVPDSHPCTILTRFFSAIHPDDLAAVKRSWDLPFDEIPTIEFRVRIGADWRWLSWSMRRDRLGGHHRFYAVAHDITGRKQAEQTLASETAFRRAMEDSIWTGMRAIDNDERHHLCQPGLLPDDGLDGVELVGAVPPYPYWLETRTSTRSQGQLSAVIAGTAPATGMTHRMRRRDGSLLQVAMYVSPLIDENGEQTGWMASMTDVTEPNRIRHELAEAHVRFNTVLDELGAAVSVAPLAPKSSIDEPLLLSPIRQYRAAVFGATSARAATANCCYSAAARHGSDWVAARGTTSARASSAGSRSVRAGSSGSTATRCSWSWPTTSPPPAMPANCRSSRSSSCSRPRGS